MLNVKSVLTGMEFWGALLAFLAAFYLSIGKTAIKDKYRALAELQMTVAVMLFCDAMAYAFRGTDYPNTYSILIISNFISFICNVIMPVFLTAYLVLSIPLEKRKYTIMCIEGSIAALAVIWLTYTQFIGYIYYIDPATNLYVRGPGFVIWEAIILAEAAGIIIYMGFKYKYLNRKAAIVILLFVVLPIIAGIVQLFVYGYSLSNIACIISSLALFGQALEENARTLIEHRIRIQKQDDELESMRMRIALSQIKPHFLYNTLNSIYYLCDKDKEKAKEMINNLSDYLRANIGSIETENTIPFEKELEHTKVYLSIEKARFQDRFDVTYQIGTTDFEIPALTLQPIVENAVKHGVCKKPADEKGIIVIRTQRGENFTEIVVTDNGVGFDMDAYNKERKEEGKHIGIRNVEQRLRIMENATMSVNSVKGIGTTVVIYIPDKKK